MIGAAGIKIDFSDTLMSVYIHPIMEQSFAVIDQEIGEHNFTPAEYAIVRRVIHTTADFEFAQLIQFSEDAIASGIKAIQQQTPIITDVGMVKQGVAGMVAKTFGNPLIAAVEQVAEALPGKTRTETGLIQCFEQYPGAIYVIGNAPTALLALCAQLPSSSIQPALVIGVPVGFISVIESKDALAQTSVPQIRVEGRKGGSPVAAAILNALIVLALENKGLQVE
jgi:precorrin-8X/cobalt-precorrin-8 methylmutase